MKKIRNFFQEVKTEMRKVNWPTKEETVKYTTVVIGATVIVALYLGALDALFFWLLETFAS